MVCCRIGEDLRAQASIFLQYTRGASNLNRTVAIVHGDNTRTALWKLRRITSQITPFRQIPEFRWNLVCQNSKGGSAFTGQIATIGHLIGRGECITVAFHSRGQIGWWYRIKLRNHGFSSPRIGKTCFPGIESFLQSIWQRASRHSPVFRTCCHGWFGLNPDGSDSGQVFQFSSVGMGTF